MSAILDFWQKVLPHIPHIIRHDFWRKLFALIFACLLTGYAYQNVKDQIELVKIDFRVPIRFVAIEDGVTLIPRDVSADITLEVPKDQKNLKNTVFYLECPLTRYQVESNSPVVFSAEMVKSTVPIAKMVVRKIFPDSLTPDIDIMDTKDVPVHPVCDFTEVMEGYQASLVQPEKPVTVRGPKKLLATIDYLETEKIPLSNVTNSFSRQVDLVSPYDKNIEILSGKVKVEVKIEKSKPRAFDGIPVQVLFGRTGANNLIISKIQPESVTVLVDSVPDISQTQIHPFLDLSDVTRPGVYTVDIKCWSDNDRIKVVEVIPDKATVTLEPVVAPASK